MGSYYFIVIAFSVIGMIVSERLKSKFNKYSQFPLKTGLSGAEIANKMLEHYGISDVKIQMGQGMLTDHYNPVTKVVNLSPDVYQGRNVASAAVAAHECGHAVQHAQRYPFLKLRSNLVPAVKFASMTQQYLLLVAFIFFNQFPQIMLLPVIAFGITALFSFVTLPVEFDASNRALVWLKSSNIAVGEEYAGAKDALKWAAMTYIVAALNALVMFLYFLLKFTGRNR